MPSAFRVLFDLALQIRLDPALRALTRHPATEVQTVEADLRRAILCNVMPAEASLTRWHKLRVFCLNLVTLSLICVLLLVVRLLNLQQKWKTKVLYLQMIFKARESALLE